MEVTAWACNMKFLLGADFLDQVDGFRVREGFVLILLCVRTLEKVEKTRKLTHSIILFPNRYPRK